MIEKLQYLLEEEGDLELTCTGSFISDGHPHDIKTEVFETTLENLVVLQPNDIFKEKRVRVYL
jgi:hypothetical protein